jgi:hypothetical protein
LGAEALTVRTWLALLVAPVLALTDQSVAYALTSWVCAGYPRWALHLPHALLLAATLAATFLAWGAWREIAPGDDGRGVLSRRRLMAGAAIASGAFSSLVIVALWIPGWLLSPCYA